MTREQGANLLETGNLGIDRREKLRSLEVEFKVMQELMRHSSLRSTLDVYTQAVGPAKRAAQAAVLSLFFAPPDLHEIATLLGWRSRKQSRT